jgi:hypothetical protein
MIKPRIFLGSSAEQAKLLRAIARGLSEVADVEPWMTTFNPGRSALDRLVAELVANIPPGAEAPEPEGAANAVATVVSGRRNRVYINAPQAGSSVSSQGADGGHSWWKIAGGVIGGLVAIAAAVFTLMQTQGWSF